MNTIKNDDETNEPETIKTGRSWRVTAYPQSLREKRRVGPHPFVGGGESRRRGRGTTGSDTH